MSHITILTSRLLVSILAQSAAHAALSRQATTDALTGVGNRQHFEQLCEAVGTHAAGGASTAVVIPDLDFFKSVNDRFGHHAGDIVLQGTASLLLRAVRHTDSVLRLGGEKSWSCCRTPPRRRTPR